MQVKSLSDFELSRTDISSSVAGSGATTETDPSPSPTTNIRPATLASRSPQRAASQASKEWTPERPSSQTSATAPWTPQRTSSQALSVTESYTPQRTSSQPLTASPWTPRPTPSNVSASAAARTHQEASRGRVERSTRTRLPGPRWFAGAFESDGYDSETLALVSNMPRTGRASETSSVVSSPGFAVVEAPRASTLTEWTQEDWPADVKLLSSQYNPSKWRFDKVSIGIRGGEGCGCAGRCNAITCLDAKRGRFCTDANCVFAANCGNALKEHSALALCRNTRTGMRGLVATATIPAGEVLGQYFGHVQLLGPPCKNAPVNEGFRMHLKTRTTGRKYVGIDALEQGGMMRMLNHSCNPATSFHEVQTGETLTVVAVTVRDIFPGEEVTVSYGDQLWFICRCGWWGCQHRELQQLPDTMLL